MKSIRHGKKRCLAFFLVICLLIAYTPIAEMSILNAQDKESSARWIYATGWSEGEKPEPIGYDFTGTPEDEIAYYVSSVSGSAIATYDLTTDASEKKLLINDVAVTVGAGGSINDEVIITGEHGKVVLDSGKIEITPFTSQDAYSGEDTAGSVVEFFAGLSKENLYTVKASTTVSEPMIVDYLTIADGQELHITAQEEPNVIEVRHNLTLATGAKLTAEEGQALLIKEGASIHNVLLYCYGDNDAVMPYVLDPGHRDEHFIYRNIADEKEPEDWRWIHSPNSDPAPGQYQIHYDGRNNAEVKIGEDNLFEGTNYDFTADVPIDFDLISPEEDTASPKVRVYDSSLLGNDYRDIIPTGEGRNWSFSYTPSEDAIISINIYWTTSEFDYGEFHRESKSYLLEFSYRGNGSVILTDEIDAEDIKEFGEWKKVRTDLPSITLTLTSDEGENELIELQLNEDERYSRQDMINGMGPDEVSYQEEDSTVTITFVEIPEEGEYKDYYGCYQFNFTGFEDGPNFPHFRLNYNENQMKVMGTELGQLERDHDYAYPELENMVLTFTPEVEEDFVGIIVRENGEPERSYIKKTELLDNGSYKYTISDFSDSYEIEAVTYRMPFNKEYMVVFDGYEDAAVKVGANSRNVDTIYSFTAGETIHFTLTKPTSVVNHPYKVEVQVNDTDLREELTVVNNSFSYTPAKDTGFIINIYWTEEEYNYYTLEPNYDNNEYLAECNVINAIGDTVVVSIPDEAAHAVHRGSTRVVLSGDRSLNINVTPAQGRKIVEIRTDGNLVSPEEYPDVNQDGTYVYSWQVTHESNRMEIRFEENGSQSGPGGPGGPGGIDNSTNFEGAKEAIEADDFAYFGTSKEAIKEYLVQELWYQYFVPFYETYNYTAPYAGMFDSKENLAAAVSLSDETYKEASAITENGAPLSYYTFSVVLKTADLENEEVAAEGRVYILNSATKVVVKCSYVENNITNDTYQVIDASVFALEGDVEVCGRYDLDDRDDALVTVFGNGTDVDGRMSGDFGSRYCVALHVTKGHTNDAGEGEINAKIVVVNSDFIGVKVTGNASNGSAAAWGFAGIPVYATNESTSENPRSINVYIGNTEIYLSPYIYGASAAIADIECTLENAQRAVLITANSGTYTIKPLSNFYDEIPLKITYANDTFGYLTIRLVAIDVKSNRRHGGSDSVDIFHGTDHQTVYTLAENEDALVAASFYYPEDADPQDGNPRIQIFATYTWADDSVTRKKITDTINQKLITEANQGSTHVDDFLLWKGKIDNAPKKIEVIAILPDTTDSKFEGAKFGSGAGVLWSNDFD